MAAGDGFVTSNLGELILRVYSRDAITKLQNFESPLLGALKNAPQFSVAGEGFRFGVDTQGGESFRFQSSESQLPAAVNETIRQAEVDPRFFAGTVQVGGLAKALAPGQPGSFADVVGYTVDRRTMEMTQYQEGALFRTSSDILGYVVTGGSGATDNGATATVTFTSPTALWCRQGMKVDFLEDTTGATLGTPVIGATISDVDWENNTVTIGSDVAAAINAGTAVIMVLTGTQAVGTGALQAVGFDGLESGVAASGEYLGIDRALYPRWEGNVIAAGSTPIDEDILQQAQIRTMQEGGISRSSYNSFRLISHYNQCRKFAEIAYPRQRFSGGSVDLGVSKLTYNGHEFLESPFCPETDVYCGDLSVFNKFVTVNGDLQISQDFGPAWRFVADYDQGMAYLRAYCNYVIRNPRRFARISGLTDVAAR